LPGANKAQRHLARPLNNTADGAAGDGDWADGNGNADRREKSRNRSSNRGGTRGSSDSRGCKYHKPRSFTKTFLRALLNVLDL